MIIVLFILLFLIIVKGYFIQKRIYRELNQLELFYSKPQSLQDALDGKERQIAELRNRMIGLENRYLDYKDGKI